MSPSVEPIGPSTFPAAPVRRLLQERIAAGAASLAELAAELRLPLRTLTRVLARDRLRWDTADRMAIALGRHPCQVWPDWFPGPERLAPTAQRSGPRRGGDREG